MPRFDLPPDQMLPIHDIRLRLDHSALPFEEEHRAAIDAHWLIEKAAQPALFNGRLLMFSSLAMDGTRLEGRCHFADFATLLYWRSLRPHPGVIHCFGHAALVSSDHALVAMRMGAHTANAGKVYFAAGSLEKEDVRGAEIDLDANMRREVGEETGFDLDAFAREETAHVLATVAGTVVFRRYRLNMTADEAALAMERHVARDPDPEIAGPVILREGDAAPEGLLPHMQAFCAWHYANPMRV